MTLAPLTSLGLVVANHSTRDGPTSLCNQAKPNHLLASDSRSRRTSALHNSPPTLQGILPLQSTVNTTSEPSHQACHSERGRITCLQVIRRSRRTSALHNSPPTLQGILPLQSTLNTTQRAISSSLSFCL